MVVEPERAREGFLPCSTFKIPNTLIGLETGVIEGEHFALKWDGKERSVAAWNRDRIGPTRMQAHLDAMSYGNRDTSRGIARAPRASPSPGRAVTVSGRSRGCSWRRRAEREHASRRRGEASLRRHDGKSP